MVSISQLSVLLVNILILDFCRTAYAAKNRYVTCGSVLKLKNYAHNTRLHSHDVKYGTGSGQQSVTATELQEDVNSHWAIRGATSKTCERGEPIKCGDSVRLHHIATNKNLHSHNFLSPLSGNQEISCYGDEKGEGDTGDHWEVICSGEWLRDSPVKLRHIDTDMYLALSGRTFGRPISGQMEVVGFSSPQRSAEWIAAEGLFIHQKQMNDHNSFAHTEL